MIGRRQPKAHVVALGNAVFANRIWPTWSALLNSRPDLVLRYGPQIATVPPDSQERYDAFMAQVAADDAAQAAAAQVNWLPPGSVKEVVGSLGFNQPQPQHRPLGLNLDNMWLNLYRRRPDMLFKDGFEKASEMTGGALTQAEYEQLVSTLGGGLGLNIAAPHEFDYASRNYGLGAPMGLPTGAIGLPPTQYSTSGVMRAWDYKGVTYTVNEMRRLVRDALTKEQSLAVRRLAERIIAGVPGKDYLSEVAALYYWVLVNLRYTRDPAHIELLTSPLQVLQPGPADIAAGRRAAQEDCETFSVVMAALCMSIGNTAEFETISTQAGVGFHHVFCVVRLPTGERVVVDQVAGPNVNEMLRSIVTHQSWPIEPIRLPGRGGFLPAISGGGVGGADSDARWGRSLSGDWLVPSAPTLEGYGPAAHEAFSRIPAHNGLGLDGWTVASQPSTELAGPPAFDFNVTNGAW